MTWRGRCVLAEMPANEAIACPFLDQGIGVLSVSDFVENIISTECPPQLPDILPGQSHQTPSDYMYVSGTCIMQVHYVIISEYSPKLAVVSS